MVAPAAGPGRTLFENTVDEFCTVLEGRTDAHIKPEWRKDPILWATERLGIPERTLLWSTNPGYENHRWDGTPEPLFTAARALGKNKWVGIEAATGTQKTYTAAIILLWFLDVFEKSEVYTLAPKEKQLTRHLWKEVGKLEPRFRAIRPGARLTHLLLRIRPPGQEWSAVGWPVGVGANEEVATKMQGAHAEHMLFIIEETPGIHSAVMEAIENTCTAPHNLILALGNPDSLDDSLHQFCERARVTHIRISALDHPNLVANDPSIVPGAASWDSIRHREEKYGKDGRLYLSRVRGICPSEPTDSMVKWSWLKAAAARVDPETTMGAANRERMLKGPRAYGVDVANSPDGDKGAIARGKGSVLLEVETFPCPDANILGDELAMELKAFGVDPLHVGVDGGGVGAGTVNQLKAAKLNVQNLIAGSGAVPFDEAEAFKNLRAQMWWQLRRDLQLGNIGLPDDEELFADLVAIRYKSPNGVIQVKDKDAIRAELGRSPDKGDAVMMWNWVRVVRGAASTGGAAVGF